MSKEYGLIIPSKNKSVAKGATVIKKPSIFEEDSDSDDGAAKPTGITLNLKRQDRIVQEKAVEEDPTVYQYDELYDEMDQKRKDSKLSRKDLDKKPKYIGRLLVAAERRKRENERRIERQVQKEREAEGEEFKDKEAFVTSAYKKKLEELREMEEQEKREDYLETIGDVRKQGNLDGFYRHLYDQKVNLATDDVVKVKDAEVIKEEVRSRSATPEKTKSRCATPEKPKTSKSRQYRKRDSSESEKSDTEAEKNPTHLPSNLDADSDFSIDSESEDDGEPRTKKVKEEPKIEEEAAGTANGDGKEAEVPKQLEVKVEPEVEVAKKEPKKPKIDIWKKRTVGKVFDEALQRYYERKALRESG